MPCVSDVFGEVAAADLHPVTAHGLHVLVGKQRDLAVPVSGVGVPDDAVPGAQLCLFYGDLLYALAAGDVDGKDPKVTAHGLLFSPKVSARR